MSVNSVSTALAEAGASAKAVNFLSSLAISPAVARRPTTEAATERGSAMVDPSGPFRGGCGNQSWQLYGWDSLRFLDHVGPAVYSSVSLSLRSFSQGHLASIIDVSCLESPSRHWQAGHSHRHSGTGLDWDGRGHGNVNSAVKAS